MTTLSEARAKMKADREKREAEEAAAKEAADTPPKEEEEEKGFFDSFFERDKKIDDEVERAQTGARRHRQSTDRSNS